jgi:hypothetical protein
MSKNLQVLDSHRVPKNIPHAHWQELGMLHGVLAWIAFLMRELNHPIMAIEDCLNRAESEQAGNHTPETRHILATIRENVNQLRHVMEGMKSLVTVECPVVDMALDEVNLKDIIDWAIKQARRQAEQRGIALDAKGVEDTGRLTVHGMSLAQSLLYLLRTEIESSAAGDRLYIYVSIKNEDFICIQITNANHYISKRILASLFQEQPENLPHDTLMNELYPAKLLLQGLGGKLSITSEKGKGIAYTIIVPKRWHSWMEEINALLLATNISRKEARAEIKNVQQLLSSLIEKVPPTFTESLHRLGGRVQELGVLCNRSLFLAEDFSSRLETLQDRLQPEKEGFEFTPE